MPDPITQDVVADSSTAPLSGPVVPLSSLSPEQRLEWRKTGQFPAAPASTDVAADSSTALEDDPPASTDASPEAASDAADPDASGYKAKTAKRIQELLDGQKRATERAEAAERRLAARDAIPAASSTATAGDDPEPDSATYDDLAKWLRDHARWAAREELRTRETAQAETQRQHAAKASVQHMQEAWSERVVAAKTKFTDFDPAVIETLIPPKSIIDAFVLDLDVEAAGTLLNHLQKNPSEVPRLLALPPMRQLADLTRLTDKVTAAPRPKLQTTAPDPGPVLGTSVTAGDKAVAAAKQGDFRAFRDEMNRREMAGRKRA